MVLKKKILIISGFILGFAFILFLFSSEVAQGAKCACTWGCFADSRPGWAKVGPIGSPTAVCLLNDNYQNPWCGTTDESYGSNPIMYCRAEACQNDSILNGANCYLRTSCGSDCKPWPESCESGWQCGQCGLKWDASNRECVECNCSNHTKFKKWAVGHTYPGIYAGCDPPPNDSYPINNGACESACGAAAECDEKKMGDSAVTDSVPESSCSGYQLGEYSLDCTQNNGSRTGTCDSNCQVGSWSSPTYRYVPGACGLCRFNTNDCSNADGVVNVSCSVAGNMWFNNNITVAAPVWMRSGSTLDINGGKTLYVQNTITMETNSTINITSGGKIDLSNPNAYIVQIINGAKINLPG